MMTLTFSWPVRLRGAGSGLKKIRYDGMTVSKPCLRHHHRIISRIYDGYDDFPRVRAREIGHFLSPFFKKFFLAIIYRKIVITVITL